MDDWMDGLFGASMTAQRSRYIKKKEEEEEKKLFMKAEYGRIDEHCTRVFRAR